MEDAVLRALAQRSKLKNLAPLKTQCVETIIENPHYFEDKQQLFSSLPSTVLDLILETSDYAPEVIKFAAQNQTQKLMLDFTDEGELSEDDVAPFCQLVKEKCQNLRGLHLFWDGDENEETYCRLLSSLPHLRELRLGGPISDRLLDSITSTKLRSLELDLGNNSPGVSTEKLCQLIQNCPLETFVAVNLDVMSNNIVGQALLSLRKLSVLRCKGMEKFIEKALAKHQKLQLKEISLNNSNFQSGLPIPNLSETLPCLQNLGLTKFSDVGPFLNFEHVTELHLGVMPWTLLIHTYASKLTRLGISGCVDAIDVSMIGYFCTNLEHLFLDDTSINQHCSYKLGQEHFSSLKSALLFAHHNEEFIYIFGNVMYRILSSPKLQTFSSGIKLPNTLLCQLIAEAEKKGVVFSEMELFYIPAQDMLAETAIKLICVMPKLKDVSFLRMSEANLVIVQQFVSENLPEVNLS